MKIVSIIGARPQFIKCAPLSRAIRREHEEILVHTGQHYDSGMSDVFFDELNIPKPDYNLGIGSGTHGEQTALMLIEIEKVLLKEKPGLVLVYGDTNSTLAGALAASKLHIKVAHVEAGLRSFDRSMPEEINRVMTDHISNLMFCPTETAVKNLKNEGITDGFYNVGDVMLDALENNSKVAEEKSAILDSAIVKAFCTTSETIVFPVHPRTEKYLKEYGLWDELCQHVKIIPPVGYLDMLNLMANSNKILTDSGGIQKEAYMLGVPCVTMRENTEWVETVEDGWNVLVGADYEEIVDAIEGFEGAGERNKYNNSCEYRVMFMYNSIIMIGYGQ